MILKFHLNDAEIAGFFNKNGFKVGETTRGYFRKTYHNRSEWHEFTVAGVEIDGKTYDAEKIFEKITEHRIKKFLTPVNLETERAIRKIAKEMNK